MDAGISALSGVALGIAGTVLKDWVFKRREEKQKGRYLAIRASAVLDLFVYDCAHVVMDDGTSRGQRSKDGYLESQVTPPRLNFDVLEGDWHSLPANLAYRVLILPSRVDRADRHISGAAEFSDPPDFEEYFEARQTDYAKLGKEAAELADDLRSYGGLPDLEKTEWDPLEPIQARLQQLKNVKAPPGNAFL